jgi:hypothetical protein
MAEDRLPDLSPAALGPLVAGMTPAEVEAVVGKTEKRTGLSSFLFDPETVVRTFGNALHGGLVVGALALGLILGARTVPMLAGPLVHGPRR